MNERIRELYKQAFGYFPAPTGEPELEKFAELIMQECIKAVSDTPLGYGDYRDQILRSMRDSCVESIKYNFGVE